MKPSAPLPSIRRTATIAAAVVLLLAAYPATAVYSEPGTETAGPYLPPRVLNALSDSLTRWCAVHAQDALAENLSAWWTDERACCVRVQLLRADSAARDDFRRRVSDSPLVRIEGFDPDTTPYPPAPEGVDPPEEFTMQAAQVFYPSGTENVRLTIRNHGDRVLFFGTDYTLCRLREGRWETLPLCRIWNALLIELGRPDPTAPGSPTPAEGYVYDFTVWLAPRVFPTRYGRYRVFKRVWTEHPHREWLLSADFILTPWIPYGPYTQPVQTP